MNLKEVEKTVGKIQRTLFKNSNSHSVGILKSQFRGSGIQFKEHQVYFVGDDVRFIDWKLSARTNNTYIKTFEEERNVEIVVFLDITPSMMYGDKGVSKLQASLEIVCLLYLLAEESKDYVSVLLYIDKPVLLPKKHGREGIVFLVSYLEKIGLMNEDGNINHGYFNSGFELTPSDKKISLMKSYIARRKEVVMLSDLSVVNTDKSFKNLLYRKNMHCFQVLSSIDSAKKLPYLVKVKDSNRPKLSTWNDTFSLEQREKIKNWKTLFTSERYLENFVKQLT